MQKMVHTCMYWYVLSMYRASDSYFDIYPGVLKSHFARPRSFVLEQVFSKSERRFVRTHWLQEVLGLSEVL